jgi:hypothetical protein
MAAQRIAGSFRHFCKKTGRSHSTAERRENGALERVADAILKKAQSLQGPSWSRVMPNQGSDFGKMATVTSWMAVDARPTHEKEMLDPLPEARKRKEAA